MASIVTIDAFGRCDFASAPPMRDAAHIVVVERRRGHEVHLHPSRTTWAGYLALVDFLEGTVGTARPIILRWRAETARVEIIAELRQFQDRLLELMSASPADTRHAERFLYQPRPLDDLDPMHPLAGLIDLWRAAGGPLDLAAQRERIDAITKGKYLVVEPDKDAGALRFAQFGVTPWYVYLDPRWISKCVAHRVEDQPDYEYGKWVSRALKSAYDASVPTVADADALVQSDGVERRMQYTRVTLPVLDRNGVRQVLSTSLRDTGVDLRQPID